MSDGISIWGRQPALEALKAGWVRRILLSRSVRSSEIIDQIQAEASSAGVPVVLMNAADLARRAPDTNAQGVIAEVANLRFCDLSDVLARAKADRRPGLLLVLDQIEDPRNLGGLLRSAVAVGAHGVVMTQRKATGITGVTVKASAGAVYHVPIARVANLAHSLGQVQRQGMWTVALDANAKTSIFDTDLRGPVAIVLGNEGRGVRRLTARRSDMIASIPMAGHIASLNVSVAGAIALFEAARQRSTR